MLQKKKNKNFTWRNFWKTTKYINRIHKPNSKYHLCTNIPLAVYLSSMNVWCMSTYEGEKKNDKTTTLAGLTNIST